MNRIESKFRKLKKRGKKAFIAFITAGDPNLKTTEELVLRFESSGVDIVELGVPFSDPLADGLTIQASSQRALQQGITLEKIFKLVKTLRKKSQIPIALMTYYNPIFHYGEERLIKEAKQCGVDGLIIPDLPLEEGRNLIKLARQNNISTIFFISPTTTQERMKKIVQASSGFIYYVSLTGVTGARKSLGSSILNQVRSVQKITDKPICVGFGISNARQVKAIGQIADGVIVGSAIIQEIVKNAGKKDLVKRVAKFINHLSRKLK